MDTLLPGINAERMPTNRLTINMLSIPDRTGPAAGGLAAAARIDRLIAEQEQEEHP